MTNIWDVEDVDSFEHDDKVIGTPEELKALELKDKEWEWEEEIEEDEDDDLDDDFEEW